jgi:hypothetical protein
VLIIRRCKERNLYLKLSKSRFGIKTVDFFGYVCSENSYHLSQERIERIAAIPFPENAKSMQRFLGASMYFKPFIYNYSQKTSSLNDMIHKSFDWTKDNWTVDYESIFKAFKEDIRNSFTLYHPDFGLPWYLYVDASDRCVGGNRMNSLPSKYSLSCDTA